MAPLIDYSGPGAAVGPVHSRDGVDYEAHAIEGLGDMPTYGIDGPPALAVILACVGGFGPRPDIVLSGINHGVNVGRSAMHSGTVGAALTGAHFGLRCLAVSIRWGDDPVPWETPAAMAAALVPVLEQAPGGDDAQPERAQRHARRAARPAPRAPGPRGHHPLRRPRHRRRHAPAPCGAARPGRPAPCAWTSPPRGRAPGSHPDTDAGLLARGYASLTALVGVREAGAEADDVVDAALEALYAVSGVTPGPDPGDEHGEDDTGAEAALA